MIPEVGRGNGVPAVIVCMSFSLKHGKKKPQGQPAKSSIIQKFKRFFEIHT